MVCSETAGRLCMVDVLMPVQSSVLCCQCRYRESMYKTGRIAYVKLLQEIGGLAGQSVGHDSSEL